MLKKKKGGGGGGEESVWVCLLLLETGTSDSNI